MLIHVEKYTKWTKIKSQSPSPSALATCFKVGKYQSDNFRVLSRTILVGFSFVTYFAKISRISIIQGSCSTKIRNLGHKSIIDFRLVSSMHVATLKLDYSCFPLSQAVFQVPHWSQVIVHTSESDITQRRSMSPGRAIASKNCQISWPKNKFADNMGEFDVKMILTIKEWYAERSRFEHDEDVVFSFSWSQASEEGLVFSLIGRIYRFTFKESRTVA